VILLSGLFNAWFLEDIHIDDQYIFKEKYGFGSHFVEQAPKLRNFSPKKISVQKIAHEI
jgi:hypothetical protein